jgi:archaellum component FlaG (FlaF/FlaG flagellin family)
MKKIFLFIATILITSSIAYSLPTFWYSGVSMNSVGSIETDTEVDVQVTINDGENLYVESHYGTYSNEFGIFVIEVGTGSIDQGDMSLILAKPNTTIIVKVRTGGDYVTIEGAALVSVYKRSFEGSRIKGGSSNLQSAYSRGNEINIEAVDETTLVERPVIIRNTNTHANLILDNQNESEGETWANALYIQRGSTRLSTYHADGESSTYDLYPYGFASIIFVDQDIYYLPPGIDGQVLYIVNTLPRGQEGQNIISVWYDPYDELSVPIIGGSGMHFVSDGYKWYPIFLYPYLY